jgi:hypothetical protein
MRSFGVLVHREHDDLADIRLVREQHDDAVDARRDASVRRRAILQAVDQRLEAVIDVVARVPGNLERAVHDLGLMIPDRARGQLISVANDVVLEGFDGQRILVVQRFEAALRHRERIVAELDFPGFRSASYIGKSTIQQKR